MFKTFFRETKSFAQETVGLTVVFFVLFAVVAAASAWTGPAGDPLVGQVSPPIYTGTATQIKSGDAGAVTLVAEQVCLADGCRTAWPHPLPECRICIRGGAGNGYYGSEVCTAFNGDAVSSGRETSESVHGRGTTIDVRVLCP